MEVLKQKPRKTIADFRSLPDESRAELIEGEILMTPSPNVRHQIVAMRLGTELQNFIAAGRLGWVVAAPTDVYLRTGEVVQPDLAVILQANHQALTPDALVGGPDLAVEILSPSSLDRDRFVKKNLYARSGIREYWIVDPDARTVELFTLNDGKYDPAGYFTGAATLRSPALPGLAIALGPLFI